MNLTVSFEVLIQPDELVELQRKADEYYAENVTEYKLYTTPKTAAHVPVHNKYARLMKAVEDWKDANPDKAEGEKIWGSGTFVQALSATQALIADHRDGRIYVAEIEDLRIFSGEPEQVSVEVPTDVIPLGPADLQLSEPSLGLVGETDESGLEVELEDDWEGVEREEIEMEGGKATEEHMTEIGLTPPDDPSTEDLAPAAREHLAQADASEQSDPFAALRQQMQDRAE